MLERSYSRSYSESTKESLAITTSNTAVLPPVKTLPKQTPSEKPKRQGLFARLISSGSLLVSGQGYPASGLNFYIDVRAAQSEDTK